MAFDIAGARAAGYSPSEIADHLAQSRSFDVGAARRSGYSDDEIINHLRAPLQQPPAPQAAPDERSLPRRMLDYSTGLQNQVMGGLTFGLNDEIRAGTRRVLGDAPSYDDALTQERAQSARFREQNPGASVAANLAGGIVGPAIGVLGPAAQGAGRVGQAAHSGLARGVVAGATGGAASGFGEGEGGLENRLGTAGSGAVLGGALGGVLGAGASAASGVAGRVMNTLGLRNPDLAADRQVLRALERDRIDPRAFGQATQGPGLPAMPQGAALVDYGNANVRGLAEAAANTPGGATEAARALVDVRRGARPERVAGAVDDALGGGGGTRVMDEVAALRTQRQTDAAPLYDRAFGRPTGMTDVMRAQIDDPIAQAGLRRGLEIQRIEEATAGRRPTDMLGMDSAIRFAEDGTPRIVGEPSTRTLDSIKRGLDDIIEGYRDPTSGVLRLDERGRAIENFRRQLVERLDQGNPDYAAARAAWAGPTQSMEALARGRQSMRADPDQVAAIVARMSPADQQFFQLGIGRAITDMAADPARAVSATRRMLEDRNMQRRLEMAIPDPGQRAQFMAQMQREVQMGGVEHQLVGGSQTARRLASQEDMGVDPPGGMMAALLMGRPMSAVGQGLSSLYRRTQGINPQTADALARRLLSTDAAQNAATVQRLTQRSIVDRIEMERRARVAAALMRGAGISASIQAN